MKTDKQGQLADNLTANSKGFSFVFSRQKALALMETW